MASERDSVFQLACEFFRTIVAVTSRCRSRIEDLEPEQERALSARLRTVAPQHAAPHIGAKLGKEGAAGSRSRGVAQPRTEILKPVP